MPPTSNSAKYHSLRVFLQVQSWLGNELESTDWGYKIVGDTLVPVTMDGQPAPPNLMAMIRCGCKGYCDSNKCTCRSNGLYCTNICSECENGLCINIDVEYIFESEN